MPANVSIPASSLLSYGTGAQTNAPVGTPSVGTGAQTNTPVGSSGTLIGLGKPLFVTKPGGGAVHLYLTLKNTLTGAITVNRDYLYYLEFGKLPPSYGTAPAPRPPRTAKPRPTRAGRSAGGGGGGGGFVGVPVTGTLTARPPVFSGEAATRIGQLNGLLPLANNGLTNPNGTLTSSTQAALIKGLQLDDFTPELVAYLDPASSVNFLIWDTGETIAYIDAELVIDAATYLSADAMNAPTALAYAALGIPVGRRGSGTDGIPTEWLVKEKGIWWIGVEGAMEIVTSERTGAPGNLTADDLRARDWVLGRDPDKTIEEIEDLTVRN